MKRNKFIWAFIGIAFGLVLFQNALINFVANVTSLFRENNEIILIENMHKAKIENLENVLSEYEKGLNNLKIVPSSSNVLAKIALRNIYNFYDFLVISTDYMVYSGNAVLNEDGLVGIIKNANKKTAKVSLLTGGAKVSVVIGDSYGVLDAYDKKTKLFVVHFINNYENVNVGDDVITSGLNSLDRGLVVGKVKQIEKKGLEQIVYVESKVDFDNLNYLYVMAKK